MRIAQISTRLHSGGAAVVARELEARYLAAGHECRFLYGYGPKGRPEERALAHQLPLTPRTLAAINRISFGLAGIDTSTPGQIRRLTELLDEADVVHLHIVHSYMASFTALAHALLELAKPVVWSIHDLWVLTGRCAVPQDCISFHRALGGCGSCPDLSAYPPARLDLTGPGWRRRRALINELGDAGLLTFVPVCDWVSGLLAEEFPTVPRRMIRNPVNGVFWAVPDVGHRSDRRNETVPSVLVVAADLEDRHKVDLDLVAATARAIPHGRVVMVGRNPPTGMPDNVIAVGEVRDHARLLQIYDESSVLLFMSRIDTVGMVVVEAALAGTPAVMLTSPGSQEVASVLGSTTYATAESLVAAVADGEYRKVDGAMIQRRAREAFDPAARAAEYLALMASLIRPKA